MDVFWQYAIVIAAIAGAAVYLAVRFLAGRKKRPQCENCSMYQMLQRKSPPVGRRPTIRNPAHGRPSTH